jgi:hypothetical protein
MDDIDGVFNYLNSINSLGVLKAAEVEAVKSNLFYTPHQKEQAIEFIRIRLRDFSRQLSTVGMVKKQTKKMTPEQKEKMKQKKALAKEKEKARKLKEKEKARKLKEKEREKAKAQKLKKKI